MKFQKLDAKQVPQIVVLSVLVVGVLGYAGFSFMGSTPSPANADAPKDERQVSVEGAAATAEGQGAGATTILPAGTPGAPFNPDPFKPGAGSEKPNRFDPNPKPVVKVQEKPNRFGTGTFTPIPPAEKEQPKEKEEKPKPIPPERPELLVTGIIDAEDGDNMALVSVGQDRHVIRVGDVLVASARAFKVNKIGMNGITLTKSKEKWSFPVGKPTEAKPDEAKSGTAASAGVTVESSSPGLK